MKQEEAQSSYIILQTTTCFLIFLSHYLYFYGCSCQLVIVKMTDINCVVLQQFVLKIHIGSSYPFQLKNR